MSESKTVAKAEIEQNLGELAKPVADVDIDVAETQEWLASLDYVLKSKGADRVRFLIEQLRDRAAEEGIQSAEDTSTPYVNTIPIKDQPAFPGNRELERRIKSIVRWNAMAMVVRANKRGGGVGGHISTFASSATLYEIAFNHFFRGRGERRLLRRRDLLPRSRVARHVQSAFLGRSTDRREPRKLSP